MSKTPVSDRWPLVDSSAILRMIASLLQKIAETSSLPLPMLLLPIKLVQTSEQLIPSWRFLEVKLLLPCHTLHSSSPPGRAHGLWRCQWTTTTTTPVDRRDVFFYCYSEIRANDSWKKISGNCFTYLNITPYIRLLCSFWQFTIKEAWIGKQNKAYVGREPEPYRSLKEVSHFASASLVHCILFSIVLLVDYGEWQVRADWGDLLCSPNQNHLSCNIFFSRTTSGQKSLFKSQVCIAFVSTNDFI